MALRSKRPARKVIPTRPGSRARSSFFFFPQVIFQITRMPRWRRWLRRFVQDPTRRRGRNCRAHRLGQDDDRRRTHASRSLRTDRRRGFAGDGHDYPAARFPDRSQNRHRPACCRMRACFRLGEGQHHSEARPMGRGTVSRDRHVAGVRSFREPSKPGPARTCRWRERQVIYTAAPAPVGRRRPRGLC